MGSIDDKDQTMMYGKLLAMGVLVGLSVSCGDVSREGRGHAGRGVAGSDLYGAHHVAPSVFAGSPMAAEDLCAQSGCDGESVDSQHQKSSVEVESAHEPSVRRGALSDGFHKDHLLLGGAFAGAGALAAHPSVLWGGASLRVGVIVVALLVAAHVMSQQVQRSSLVADVMASQWGKSSFPDFSGLEGVLRGLRENSKKNPFLHDVAGTVGGSIRESLNAANRQVQQTLEGIKERSEHVSGDVSDQLGKILDGIHEKTKAEVAKRVHQGRLGVDGSVEYVRGLWREGITAAISDLDRYLSDLLKDLLGRLGVEEITEEGVIVTQQEKKRRLYEALGLEEGASLEEVRQRFYRIAKENHPDLQGVDEEKLRKFMEAQEAYSGLKEILEQSS